MVSTILLVIAFVCFLGAAAGLPAVPPRFNLIGLGLALWVLSVLLGGLRV